MTLIAPIPQTLTTAEMQLAQGMAMGSVVMTMEGALPVEYLAVGDRVVTRNGARQIRAITVMVANDASVLRLSQSSLGHDRPEADILLAPGQPVLIRDWRAKALFGNAQALVAASRLVDGTLVRQERCESLRLFALHFDTEEVIYVGGLELGCTPALVNA